MNRYEKYYLTDVSENNTVFTFTSTGPRGNIDLEIQFALTAAPNVFNLAFGNKKPNGEIDDSIINNNSDRNKILTTVALAVFNFTKRFPESCIYFTGSTDNRNRLYRMAITVNYLELSQLFRIWGLTDTDKFEPFQKNCFYKGFLVQRK
jgi:hypothetical protein